MTHKPPVPPENRSPKGRGGDPDTKRDNPPSQDTENIDQTGERGNIRQNTTHQQPKR